METEFGIQVVSLQLPFCQFAGLLELLCYCYCCVFELLCFPRIFVRLVLQTYSS